MAVRVLLVESDVVAGEELTVRLTDCGAVDAVHQVRTAAEAVGLTAHWWPHLVLIDLEMPSGGAVTAVRQILRHDPTQAVAMLVGSEDAVSEQALELATAIRLGARGYLLKTATPAELKAALGTLAEGGAVVTPHLARDLLNAFAVTSMTGWMSPLPVLTPSEREVLTMLRQGMSQREIADRAARAENTVRVHLRNVLDKFRYSPDEPPDLMGASVPRRPPPGGPWANAAATPPEDDGRRMLGDAR